MRDSITVKPKDNPLNQPHFLAVTLPLIFISGLGLMMLRTHLKTRKSQMEDPSLAGDEQERIHLDRQFRRRMQTSGLLVLIGVLIAAGQFIDGQAHPTLFTFYWLGVILLAFWLILLALGDAVSIANYSRIAQARLDVHKRELEAELERLKARQGNGHSQTLDSNSDHGGGNESV